MSIICPRSYSYLPNGGGAVTMHHHHHYKKEAARSSTQLLPHHTSHHIEALFLSLDLQLASNQVKTKMMQHNMHAHTQTCNARQRSLSSLSSTREINSTMLSKPNERMRWSRKQQQHSSSPANSRSRIQNATTLALVARTCMCLVGQARWVRLLTVECGFVGAAGCIILGCVHSLSPAKDRFMNK